LVTGVLPGQNQPLYPFGIDQDNLQGPPDFSFLNHSLTGADRVFVKDGHFYTVGEDLSPNTEDDQRIRFYGVNLAFGANSSHAWHLCRCTSNVSALPCTCGISNGIALPT